MVSRRAWILGGAAALLAARAGAVRDETWRDTARRRDLPVRLRWPHGDEPCALVVHSHGLGGDRSGGSAWGEAWQRAGFAVLHLQHPGSDASLLGAGLAGLRRGAGVQPYLDRIADAHFVLDEIDRRRTEGVWRRVRADAIGFAGHSFGARLTQAIAGERPATGVEPPWRLDDPRPRAFIAFSPGSPASAADDGEAQRRFGRIDRPFLCVTGSADGETLVGDATHAGRRAVYRGLPPGQKAELVLDGADHLTFGGQDLAGLRRLRRDGQAAAAEPRHHDLVARISTDWWRWRLLGERDAAARLERPEGLRTGDIWQQG